MKPAKVLIIEDNFQNRYLFKLLLAKGGMEVIEAEDGRSGIAMAAEMDPDLILLDIQLPDIDGYQVARELRGRRRFDGLPIIAVTSYAMAGDREKSLAAGCTGYIEKPINPTAFMEQIRGFLNGDAAGS